MTCSIPRLSPQELFDEYKQKFSVNVLGGGEVVPESNEWYVVGLNYAMAETFQAISDQEWKERDPRWACCENLYDIAALDGKTPRTAKASEGYVRITGTAGSQLPERIHVADSKFQYSAIAQPLVMPDSGEIILRVRNLTIGSPGNSAPSSEEVIGQLVTTAPGLNSEVSFFNGRFCGGEDDESCEAFRTRYLNERRYTPRASLDWMKQKLLEWPCVTRVFDRRGSCCEPNECSDCGTKFEFYVLFDGTFDCGLAPQSCVDEVSVWFFGPRQGYGEGQVDIGICGQLYAAEAAKIDIEIFGAGCFTIAQKALLEQALRDLFSTLAPSQTIAPKQIEIIAAQILGYIPELEVILKTESTRVTQYPCGDIEPDCDVMACFNSLSYPDDGATGVGGCG